MERTRLDKSWAVDQGDLFPASTALEESSALDRGVQAEDFLSSRSRAERAAFRAGEHPGMRLSPEQRAEIIGKAIRRFSRGAESGAGEIWEWVYQNWASRLTARGLVTRCAAGRVSGRVALLCGDIAAQTA